MGAGISEEVAFCIPFRPFVLLGSLLLPTPVRGIVLFTSGAGRHRSHRRGRFVAHALHQAELGVCFFDPLTSEEERGNSESVRPKFDVDMVAGRLVVATDWLRHESRAANLPLGYLLTGTDAAAGLIAASERSGDIGAIVSHGGRPAVAGPALAIVRVPTLLVVGEKDRSALADNRRAFQALPGSDKRLEVVPGAKHAFAKPDALEHLARVASDWFRRYLVRSS